VSLCKKKKLDNVICKCWHFGNCKYRQTKQIKDIDLNYNIIRNYTVLCLFEGFVINVDYWKFIWKIRIGGSDGKSELIRP